MKILFTLFFSSLALAVAIKPEPLKTRIEKVTSFEWDGKNYIIHLSDVYKPVVLTEDSTIRPCLENAIKSNLEVLVEINPEVPSIESCKLYSRGMPVPQTLPQ